jgi:hypothetical protein
VHVYGRLNILEFAWNRLCPILLPPFPPMDMGQYLWWGCTSTTISSSGLWPKAILYYDYYIINMSENRLHTIESSGLKKTAFSRTLLGQIMNMWCLNWWLDIPILVVTSSIYVSEPMLNMVESPRWYLPFLLVEIFPQSSPWRIFLVVNMLNPTESSRGGSARRGSNYRLCGRGRA